MIGFQGSVCVQSGVWVQGDRSNKTKFRFCCIFRQSAQAFSRQGPGRIAQSLSTGFLTAAVGKPGSHTPACGQFK